MQDLNTFLNKKYEKIYPINATSITDESRAKNILHGDNLILFSGI